MPLVEPLTIAKMLPINSDDPIVFTGYNRGLWTLLAGLSVPLVAYAGYKAWTWLVDAEVKAELAYEYKYQTELDELLDGQVDDLENPDLKDQDTIKIDSSIFSLERFKSFSRNSRKKLVRRAVKQPRVKRVAIPANEFDWDNSFTSDETPRGKVVMKYCPETESFWYYSDSPNIPYKYLETVARKYVCDHNRLDVFVDIREELRKGTEEAKQQTEKVKTEEGNKQESHTSKQIYAKFKRYNKKNARSSANSKRITVIRAKANRYSHRGKIADFDELLEKKASADKEDDTKVPMTYMEWVRLNENVWESKTT